MVELKVNNLPVELPKGTNIKYTKQISDIFDLANVACSFTNSFEFDKTPANTQAMQFLGISGDNSNIPYIKNEAVLKSNGFDLNSKGWFHMSSTDDKYKGSVIDGMIDFFKAIENRTMGKDLDLSNFNHQKILDTVVESFSNEYYQYIIADYGGKVKNFDAINIDYLAPCFSVKKLWELIFSTFNFNCDYSNLSYLDNLYLTYPKDTAQEKQDTLIAKLSKEEYKSQYIISVAGVSQPSQFYSWYPYKITQGELMPGDWKFVVPSKSSYFFDFQIEMYVTYRRPNYYNPNVDVSVEILKNGIRIGGYNSPYNEGTDEVIVGEKREIQFTEQCEAGDVIEVKIFSPQTLQFRNRNYRCYEWNHKKTEFKIYKTDLGTTNLENELKDFLIKDFIKEIIWRTGLTPLLDKDTKTVYFKTLDSRVDFNNAQDMSHTFVRRSSETYTNEYAQKNIFKLKKNNESDNSGDGYLYVYNRNLEDEKVIVQSKIYCPDLKIVTDISGFSTNQYKIWEKEIKGIENGIVQIEYKGLSGRFFFIRKQNIQGNFTLSSDKLNDQIIVSEIPAGINTDTLFEEAIYKNYSEYQKIFVNFRIHNIELVLTENDFIGLDLTRPIFFKQENAYYICNKVNFEEGKNSIGEFIKINKI